LAVQERDVAFSRQFRALAKVSAFFAAAWAAAGSLIGALGGVSVAGGAAAAAYTLGVVFACVGGITGAVTALLVGRAESGRDLSELRAWRVASWSVLGGILPATWFSSMGVLFFGASAAEVVGLLTTGLVSGGVGAIISTSAFATAKRSSLVAEDALRALHE